MRTLAQEIAIIIVEHHPFHHRDSAESAPHRNAQRRPNATRVWCGKQKFYFEASNYVTAHVAWTLVAFSFTKISPVN
jgi:hypothetical protein